MKIYNASFVNFVYPFLFNADDYSHHTAAFDNSTVETRNQSADDSKHKYPVWKNSALDISEMLPHVAQQVKPNAQNSTLRFWKMNEGALRLLGGEIGHNDWRLVLGGAELITFNIPAVQLMLLAIGVGFITVTAKPQSSDVKAWLDFVHYFRFTRGQRRVRVRLGNRREVTFNE